MCNDLVVNYNKNIVLLSKFQWQWHLLIFSHIIRLLCMHDQKRKKKHRGHFPCFSSVTSVHWVKQCTVNTAKIYIKLRPYSLTKINWIDASWVLSKLKTRSCGHQITFHVNSTFCKLLHIIPSSFLTICGSCERCLCFASHLEKPLVFILSPYHGSAHVNAWCWKTHSFTWLWNSNFNWEHYLHWPIILFTITSIPWTLYAPTPYHFTDFSPRRHLVLCWLGYKIFSLKCFNDLNVTLSWWNMMFCNTAWITDSICFIK